MKIATLAIIIASVLFTSGVTVASTSTSSAAIAATIANTCSIGTVTNPTTPTMIAGQGRIEIGGSFPLTCTSGDSTSIAIGVGGNGTGAGTASPTRALHNSTNLLSYNIYQAPSQTTLWGDDAGVNTKAISGNGTAQTQNFYVDIYTPAYTLPAGSYTDAVTITVTY